LIEEEHYDEKQRKTFVGLKVDADKRPTEEI